MKKKFDKPIYFIFYNPLIQRIQKQFKIEDDDENGKEKKQEYNDQLQEHNNQNFELFYIMFIINSNFIIKFRSINTLLLLTNE